MASGSPERHMDRLGRRLGDRFCNPVLAAEERVAPKAGGKKTRRACEVYCVETSAGQRRHSLFQRVGEEIVFVCINLNFDWFAISNHNFKRLAEFQRARKLRVRHRPCRKIINPAISSVHNDFFNRCAVYSAGNFDEPKIAHSIMASH